MCAGRRNASFMSPGSHTYRLSTTVTRHCHLFDYEVGKRWSLAFAVVFIGLDEATLLLVAMHLF